MIEIEREREGRQGERRSASNPAGTDTANKEIKSVKIEGAEFSITL